jgi:uncharacterized protein (DUF1501 family)
VVRGGEFGRTPFNEKGNGRDHNLWSFPIWMAGGGVKGGQTIGAIGEIGLDHERLTYTRNGRAERPTITSGAVIVKLTT